MRERLPGQWMAWGQPPRAKRMNLGWDLSAAACRMASRNGFPISWSRLAARHLLAYLIDRPQGKTLGEHRSAVMSRAATVRRIETLFQAMETDLLLREQFITGPSQVLTEYLVGPSVSREQWRKGNAVSIRLPEVRVPGLRPSPCGRNM